MIGIPEAGRHCRCTHGLPNELIVTLREGNKSAISQLLIQTLKVATGAASVVQWRISENLDLIWHGGLITTHHQ